MSLRLFDACLFYPHPPFPASPLLPPRVHHTLPALCVRAFFFLRGVWWTSSWNDVLKTMVVGELARVVLAPSKAYGVRGSPPKIPPNATLCFEIELHSACQPSVDDVVDAAEAAEAESAAAAAARAAAGDEPIDYGGAFNPNSRELCEMCGWRGGHSMDCVVFTAAYDEAPVKLFVPGEDGGGFGGRDDFDGGTDGGGAAAAAAAGRESALLGPEGGNAGAASPLRNAIASGGGFGGGGGFGAIPTSAGAPAVTLENGKVPNMKDVGSKTVASEFYSCPKCKIKIPAADVPTYQKSHGGCKFCGEPFPGGALGSIDELRATAAGATGGGGGDEPGVCAAPETSAMAAAPPPLPTRPRPSANAATAHNPAAAPPEGASGAAAAAVGLAAAAAAAEKKPRGFAGRVAKSFKSAFGW